MGHRDSAGVEILRYHENDEIAAPRAHQIPDVQEAVERPVREFVELAEVQRVGIIGVGYHGAGLEQIRPVDRAVEQNRGQARGAGKADQRAEKRHPVGRRADDRAMVDGTIGQIERQGSAVEAGFPDVGLEVVSKVKADDQMFRPQLGMLLQEILVVLGLEAIIAPERHHAGRIDLVLQPTGEHVGITFADLNAMPERERVSHEREFDIGKGEIEILPVAVRISSHRDVELRRAPALIEIAPDRSDAASGHQTIFIDRRA